MEEIILSFDETIDKNIPHIYVYDEKAKVSLTCKSLGWGYLLFNKFSITPLDGCVCTIEITSIQHDEKQHSTMEITEKTFICQKPVEEVYPNFKMYINDEEIECKKYTFDKIINITGKFQIEQIVYIYVDR